MVAFAEEAAAALAAERADGAELPYDVVQAGRSSRGGTPLYCYRPMTGEFILARFDGLRALDPYVPALRALAALDGLGHYLRAHGRRGVPVDRRSCAELTLFVFLSELFDDATDFELSPERLGRTYGALESTLFAEVSHTTFLGLAHGVEIISSELLLGGGLALLRPEALDDGPPDALPPGGDGEAPSVLVTLSMQATPGESGVLEEARSVLSGLVEALNLFGDACVAIDPGGWMRVDDGPWQVVALGRQAPARGVLRVAPLQEDELRAFCSLVARRAPRGGELAWALARFRMGCEREHRWDGLSDHLLALRALLEPEGPESGRLPGRLAALCAMPDERPALAERVVDVIALERAVMTGLEPADREAEALLEEVTGHLRALLRDVTCGHLDHDVQGLADRLIADAAAEQAAVEQPLAESEDDEPAGPAGEWEPDGSEAVDVGDELDEDEDEVVDEDDDEDDGVDYDEPVDADDGLDYDESVDERGGEAAPDQLWADEDESVDQPVGEEDVVDEPAAGQGPDESGVSERDEPAAPPRRGRGVAARKGAGEQPDPQARTARAKARPARKNRAPSRPRRAPTRTR
jgi:hypothetical protein